MPDVWKSYTHLSFKPTQPHISRAVAIKHKDWLCTQFYKTNRRYPNNIEFYCMWNLGWNKFTRKYRSQVMSCPSSTLDAAMRLEAVYQQQFKN